MPKFVIEKTSGDGNQFEIVASSKVEALRMFLVHPSNIAEVLAEHDSGSDPECVYLNVEKDDRGSYLNLNIWLANRTCAAIDCDNMVDFPDFCEDHKGSPECVVPSCTTRVSEDGDVCEDCTPEGGFDE